MLDKLLLTVPLWLAGLIIVIICLLAAEAARLVFKRIASRLGYGGEPVKSDGEGYIIGAIFALFAFMVGLTFSIAIQRFDERRGWVAVEANAIDATFRGSQLFDEPYRSQLQATLRDYAHTRIAPDGLWNIRMEQQLERSRQLRQQLWNETRQTVYPVRETDLASSFVESVNSTFDAGLRREWAGTAHIPDRIVNALLLYLIVTSAVLGYLSGKQRSGLRLPSYFLFALFASAIVLILDLDRPRGGTIKVSQKPLEELVATLDRVKLPRAAERN
jgi:hypothetical protein